MTEIPAGKVPVIACVVASWKFLGANWRQFLPAALIVGVVSGLAPLLLASGGLTLGETYLFGIIALLASVFLHAAVLRKAVRQEFPPPIGLAFGQDEGRILGVFASIGLLMLPCAILAGIIYFFVLIGSMGLTSEQMEEMSKDQANAQDAIQQAMNNLPNTPAGATLGLLAIIGLCILLLIFARLWVIGAATIGESKIVFFQTWSWSKGNVLRIAAAILMTWGPTQLATYLLGGIGGEIAKAAPNAVVLAVVAVAVQTIAAFAAIPQTALSAELYRGLKPPGFVPK